MSDLALQLAANGRIDLAISGGDLVRETSLETCVLLCLYTDAQAGEDDVIPDGSTDRRGWWASSLQGLVYGSLLWLLSREKHTTGVAERAREYADEALAWMVDAGLASRIDVQTTLLPGQTLYLGVTVHQRNGSSQHYEYNYLWDSHALSET